jgi:dipeptidyl aminopeptidase/acylaminoacyl peptidase
MTAAPHGWRLLLHRALLHGLRPQRLAHRPALEQRVLTEGTITAMPVLGARGQRVAAWLTRPAAAHAADPLPCVVAVHGWGANASSLWTVVPPLLRQGWAVALFDVSSHGDSSGEDFCSLPRFAEDLQAVLAAVRSQAGIAPQRVALLGHSVGAAAVLLHAARRRDVRAVVSLSAFAHPQDMMERWLRAHHLPRRWLGQAILDHVQHTIGARFDDIAPVHRVADIACPLMLVHGQHDRTVPLGDGLRLRAARPDSAWLVVDADHDLREALQHEIPRLVRFLEHALAA